MTALTEQERAEIERLFGFVPEPEPLEHMLAAVERILATRLAAADARIDSLTIAVKAMGKRADDAEAALERVRALADEWMASDDRAWVANCGGDLDAALDGDS